MRLSKEQKKAKIVEGYRRGDSYKQLQKTYHVSSRDIARLVEGIEVRCALCGKLKGKAHFHAHHPDRANQPNFTIPLCPSCHAKEEARIRKHQSSLLAASTIVPTAFNKEPAQTANKPPSRNLFYQPPAIRGKDLLIAFGVCILLPAIWNDIQRYWQQHTD